MRKFLFLALLCPFFSQCMPSKTTTPPLSVGDAVHPFTITNVVNHSSSSIAVPASGTKIYILNFVAIACRSCAKDYARLDALQKQFAKDIEIILVTAEDSTRVNTFLRTNHIGQNLHLPVATADTTLASWFPHQFLSHTVWLQNGRVKGITDPQYINQNNIEILLMGRWPGWPVKKEDATYNAAAPLLTYNPASLSNAGAAPPFYSAFSGRINGLTPSVNRVSDSSTASVKTTILNQTAINAYLFAYNLRSDFPVSQIRLNVADTADFIYNEGTDYKLGWEAQNTFSYEAVFPATLTRVQQQQKMVRDLDFYFGLISSFENTTTSCLALTIDKTDNPKPLLTSGSVPQFLSLSNLVYYLNHHWYGTPVFNETGITQKRYIPFNQQAFANPQTLQTWLKPYGLQLTPVQKQLPVLTLTQNTKTISDQP